MRFTPKPLEHLDHPESYRNHDTFDTASVRERLSNLVGSLEGHGVIVLDGPWGSGKTTFAKMWARHLENRGHPVVWIDAFETDHHDDAFLPMMHHIASLLEAHDSPEHDPQDPDSQNPPSSPEQEAGNSDSAESPLSRLLAQAAHVSPLLRAISVGIPAFGTVNLGLAFEGVVELTTQRQLAKVQKRKVRLAFKKRPRETRSSCPHPPAAPTPRNSKAGWNVPKKLTKQCRDSRTP